MNTIRLLLALLILAPVAARAQAPFPAQPPCGNAYLFEPGLNAGGTMQYDQVTINGFPALTDAFTIEAWVKYHAPEGVTTWPAGFHTIAAFGQVNSGSTPLLAVRFGELELYNGNSRLYGGAVPLNTWTHVAYTWDGATSRLYVNGQETASSPNSPNADGNNFYIGYSRGNTGWNGLIDEVLVWHAARTPAEIDADARGRVRSDAASLRLYFKFDEIYQDAGTGLSYAVNERGAGGPHGFLGWTEDYTTGAPRLEPTEYGPDGSVLLTCGLNTPLGIAIDAEGRLHITETGTGQNDGTVLLYTPGGGSGPVVTQYGLASEIGLEGTPAGTNQLARTDDGLLLVTQGPSSTELSQKLLVIAPAFGQNGPFEAIHDVGGFVLSRGFAESNPYAVAVGPEDDYFVVDAAANAIVRVENVTGYMTIFATFDPVPNPSPAGPPMVDAVPTGIAFDGGRFYVSGLTGFPFNEGAARLYAVDLEGNVSVYRDGLTTLVDVDLDPRDGLPVVLEFARTGALGAFLPETGRLVKLYPGYADTLARGITMPTALVHAPDGTRYVTTMNGHLLRYPAGTALDKENPAERPQTFALEQNYPNPFNPTTQVRFQLDVAQPVRLAAYDLLGRQVALLASGPHAVGTHTVTWDASGFASGVYLLRLETPAGTSMQRAVLLK